MKILVTGAAGFIGSNLIKHLNVQYPQAEIVVFDNLYSGNWYNLQNLNCKFYYKDISDSNFLIRYLNYFDYIFHLAAITDTTEGSKDLIFKTNINSFPLIAEYCKKDGVIVAASSASVYGNEKHDSEFGYSEGCKTNPLNPYAFSKLQMEKWISNDTRRHVFTRFFNVYGLGDEYKRAGTCLLTSLCEQASKGTINIFENSLDQKRDYVEVNDVCRCLVELINCDKNDIINIGAGDNKSGAGYASISDLIQEFNRYYKFRVRQIKPNVALNRIQTNTLANNQKILKFMHKNNPDFMFKSYYKGVEETSKRFPKIG